MLKGENHVDNIRSWLGVGGRFNVGGGQKEKKMILNKSHLEEIV